MRVAANVISIYTGSPINEVPEYEDRRRRSVVLKVPLVTGECVEVQGEPTVFGFIIHYTIGLKPESRRRYCGWNKWSITEPKTGMRVAHGSSRRDALFDLAWRVALHGGTEQFEARVGRTIEQCLARNGAIAAQQ